MKSSTPSMTWEQAAADAKVDADTFRDKVAQASTDGSSTARPNKTTTGNARVPSFVNRSRALAWLRSTGRSPLYTSGKDGWKTLEMQLKDGDGLMTVQTRHGKDSVSVTVGFSDARMRAQVAASVNQLQEMLQSQYDTNVDFSLMGDGANNAHQHAGSEQTQQRGGASSVSAEATAAEPEHEASTRRALATGAQHEWIG